MTAPDELRERKSAQAKKAALQAAASASTEPVEASSTHVPSPPPTPEVLPFSKQDIIDCIPAHCFERSTFWSFAYLFRDALLLALLVVGVTAVTTSPALPAAVKALAWPLYWWGAGWVATGVWVIAHECGHQAFSDSETVNWSVGWALHSALLVPFHSWRITHAQHHAKTNSMEDDAIFVPPLRSEAPRIPASHAETLWEITGMILFGWPLYLLTNTSGPRKHRGKRNDHFTPWASMFARSQAAQVVVSDLGLLLALAALAALAARVGVLALAAYYGVPLLIVNANLVIITYLQHTDVFVPHYRAACFSWLRGAISTVDRVYGCGADVLWHHITDTHVVHHLFPTMPWYHAQEATAAVAAKLGPFYLRDTTPAPLALWRAWTRCRFVEDTGDVIFYKSRLADE